MSEESQPLNALRQGHRLQEYELVRVLGFGGFGMTYLGFDHNLDKPVAVKEYLPSDIAIRTDARSVAPQASNFRGDFQWGLERFLDEARTLARFDHPNIIRVYRFFEAHGTGYIVMEYAEGEPLSAHLERKGPLQEAELKVILYPLLDGLEVVHQANFLHRDIKPGNIVLRDSDGSPVLLDFGSARQAVGTKSRSVTSIVTPGYAPIEQYSSRGRQGPWTDLYALGGVCYRVLTGQVPQDATDRMRHDPLVPVVKQCAGRASAAFLSSVDWALSVDEGDRPQSVGAWREAMEGMAAEKVVDDVPSVRRVEQKKPRFKRRASAGASFPTVLIFALCSLVIVLGLYWFVERESDCEIVLDHVQSSRGDVELEELGVELACRKVRGGVQLGTVIGSYTYWDGKVVRQPFIDVLRAQRDGTMEKMTEAEQKALLLNAILNISP